MSGKKKLIILDLNGILISRVFTRNLDEDLHSYGKLEDQLVYYQHTHVWKRPFVQEFLEMLFEYYDVAVWTTMTYNHAKMIIPWLFGEYEEKLQFTFTQSSCWALGSTETGKPSFAKVLSDVFTQFPQYNQQNTLILDDSPRKCIFNAPSTLYSPSSWDYTMQDDIELSANGEIYQFFANHEAVPTSDPHRTKKHKKQAWDFIKILLKNL